jgi:hypothetical protein
MTYLPQRNVRNSSGCTCKAIIQYALFFMALRSWNKLPGWTKGRLEKFDLQPPVRHSTYILTYIQEWYIDCECWTSLFSLARSGTICWMCDLLKEASQWDIWWTEQRESIFTFLPTCCTSHSINKFPTNPFALYFVCISDCWNTVVTRRGAIELLLIGWLSCKSCSDAWWVRTSFPDSECSHKQSFASRLRLEHKAHTTQGFIKIPQAFLFSPQLTYKFVVNYGGQ